MLISLLLFAARICCHFRRQQTIKAKQEISHRHPRLPLVSQAAEKQRQKPKAIELPFHYDKRRERPGESISSETVGPRANRENIYTIIQ